MMTRLMACWLLMNLALQAQDTSLHEFLIEGETWQPAASGFVFTDGLCADAAGNVFFSDVKEGKGIYKINVTTGETGLVHDDLPGISGLYIGPDKRFYACQNREQRVIAVDGEGKVQVLVEGVKCNDLVVTKSGYVFFTETPTQTVHVISPDGVHRVADQGKVTRPNGIALSSDEQTLVVSDSGGLHVWAWQIQEDGSLTAGAPYMTMLPALGKEVSAGDGSATEGKGRYFVTTEIGIQIFDPAGRLAGIIAKPAPNLKVVSVAFGGPNHDTLFVAAGDTIYSRKLKTPGYVP